MKLLILILSVMPITAQAWPCPQCEGLRRPLLQPIQFRRPLPPALNPEDEDDRTAATVRQLPPAVAEGGPCARGTSVQRDLCAAVNQLRAGRGLASLQLDDRMNRVAQLYAEQMARTGSVSHTGPGGESPFDRMDRGGVRYMSAAENIAGGQRSVAQVLRDWRSSPGHNENLVHRGYRRHGVGHYNGYWVHIFAD